MRIVLLLVMCVWPFLLYAASPKILELRKLYYQAAGCRVAADSFLYKAEHMNPSSDPLILCYRGVAQMIRASYYNNPCSKLSGFRHGKSLMEQAVKTDPGNIEIRFLRFCVQTKAPHFLGYDHEIEKDKTLILNNWREIRDADLKDRIKNYLLLYGRCDKSEKKLLL